MLLCWEATGCLRAVDSHRIFANYRAGCSITLSLHARQADYQYHEGCSYLSNLRAPCIQYSPSIFARPHPFDTRAANLIPDSDTPQIFTLCGYSTRSTCRTLRHELEVDETVSSKLPGIPNAVCTVKTHAKAQYDSHIVLSFVNGTLVLSVG